MYIDIQKHEIGTFKPTHLTNTFKTQRVNSEFFTSASLFP